ncbi:MAG: RepB family plasmid replication initiator protein [Treponema sp.]|nr:RepB family plasmid replication initiator protein [Treponema sp.]
MGKSDSKKVKKIDGEIVSSKKKSYKIEKSVIADSVSTSDQIEHQTVILEDGRTIDLDTKHFDIVDSDGRIVFDAEGQAIASIAKDELTYGNFIRTYKESSKEALLLLLALQSNATPLKRGGLDVAYMTDILLDHMIVQFSEEANIIWEALSAMQSSRPEDYHFTLTADDLKPYTSYKSDEALYNAFKKGCEEIKKQNLEFDIPDPNLDGHNVMVHWNDGAEWFGNNKKTGEKAHFEVYTNDFYRVLMSSSGILHGAHWSRKISRSLKGYARSLYLFCARNRKYEKYKGATKGLKELTLEETKYELKIDEKIEAKAISRRLKQAQDKINSLPGSEFTVNITKVPQTGKIKGFRFEIKETRLIEEDTKAGSIKAIEDKHGDDALFSEIKMLMVISKLDFTDEQIEKITEFARSHNKDGQYMMQIISSFKTRLEDKTQPPISEKGKVGYLCKMIELGVIQHYNGRPGFNSFTQNSYDFDELESQLLDN